MSGTQTANRLIHETSPYLRQHAHNPVDWYPWGEEALRRARDEDKPIFLSIGYAACHWCHVMERESFEDPAIARQMNESFVNIKVDREERPDLDDTYMTAVQLLTGAGGWPMSVWLTPDLKPFYGGTYFPPQDRWGRAGFPAVLAQLASAWRNRRAEVEQAANQMADAIRQAQAVRAGRGSLSRDLVGRAVSALEARFDRRWGGFGSAPKFPPSMGLALLLRCYHREQEPAFLQMVTGTLDGMARGGMYDQVGGGFHRYSTDERWLVPHFEKMLYDNALLVPAYLEAYQVTGAEEYRRIVGETLEWVRREMTHPDGGFFSTLDADSEGVEGKFYVWTPGRVLQMLGADDGTLFNRIYDITARGNFEGESIPHLDRPIEEWADELQEPADALHARLSAMRARLREARAQRVWPAKDDKILTGWNGLMITAFARAAQALGNPEYAGAARRAAEFVLSHLRRDGRLLHTFRDGTAKLPAYLDDYSFLARGLLDLHAATGEDRWLREARALVTEMVDLFWDDQAGAFFFTARDQEAPIARGKNPYDGAIPSGNSIAVMALLRLVELGEDSGLEARCERTLLAFRDLMERAPDGFHAMLLGLDQYLDWRSTHPAPAEAPDVVALEARPESDVVHAGQAFRVVVRLRVQQGWHINANPASEPHLAPTVVEVSAPAGIQVGRVHYPAPAWLQTGFTAAPLAVYEGDVEVPVDLSAAPDAEPGERQIAMVARFQACDAQRCLAPRELSLQATVSIERSA